MPITSQILHKESYMLPQLYEKFQHWSDGGSVWIYSDTHFADEDCNKMDANWISVDEQINIINAKVHKNDTLIILGDIGDKSYIPKLNANYKVLIAGNHDLGLSNYKKKIIKRVYDADKYKNISALKQEVSKKFPTADICITKSYEFHSPFVRYNVTIDDRMFDEVYGGALFIGEKILLSHEPIDLPFALNIHGHTHNSVGYGYKYNQFNVCSNCVGYEPQNLGQIIKAGYLKGIENIHRITINNAIENKYKKD